MAGHTIIFLGPQGSGKGTQVERLLATLANVDNPVLHLQTGDAFRRLNQTDNFTARRVTETINAGNLVPDFLTNALVVREFVEQLTPETTIVLDGYPRNRRQAEVLEEALTFYERPMVSVIFLDTPDEVVKERMRERGRADDTQESIAERLRLYHEVTTPLLEYYRARANTHFLTIDGTQSIDAVTEAIIHKLTLI